MKTNVKQYLVLTFLIIFLINCTSSNELVSEERECGTHNGKLLFVGPKGGCYYYNSNGNKEYVDRSECNC
ncbi:hypothetical protein [Tenacibaculum sp. 190524A05c]|uniref:hypothetical protein n=1 Tax=Tenacibaculum platacis TaxID=3137852 RepID=UPI0032B1F311